MNSAAPAHDLSRFAWHEAPFPIPAAALAPGFPGHTSAIVYAPRANRFIVLARSRPSVHGFAPNGTHVGSWGHPELIDAHGLTLVTEPDDAEVLWITDRATGLVAKFTLDGRLLQTLPRPDHPAYSSNKPYKPTWVAVEPHTRDIWLADGYGAHLVHLFAEDGRHLASFDGTADPGLPAYACPHGIAFRASSTPHTAAELWLADRNAARVRIYDSAGRFLRHLDGIGNWPCSFAFHNDLVAIPCLKTGVRFLRGEASLGELGVNPWARAGWPAATKPSDAEDALPGRFHAPHSACFGLDGSLYVAELKAAGRIVKLTPPASL